MGLNMAITELESEKALCRTKKMMIAKVYLPNPGQWEPLVETDRIIDLRAAEAKMGKPKLEELLKKYRLKPEGDTIHLEKIKDGADQKVLAPFTKDVKTGWILMEKVPEAKKNAVVAAARKEDAITEWDLVEFEDMYATCAKCGLSWDNKKGCVGNFGPSGSPVPELAKKYGLAFLPKVDEYASQKRVFTPQDAKKLLEEVKVLREKAPGESKMIARRIEGTLNRLEAMAKCAVDCGVGFYFF